MNNNLDALALSLCPSLDWDRDKDNWVEGFKAGVAAAGNNLDILQVILQPFLEWVDTNYCNHGVTENRWSGRKLKQWLKEKNIPREELIQKYFADNKQKEDLDKG